MNGIVIWSQSNCRSTMALYRELIRELNASALITLWHYNKCEGDRDIREQIGFSHDEFSDLPIEPVGEDWTKGLSVLKSHSTWHHVFCVWHHRSDLLVIRHVCYISLFAQGDVVGSALVWRVGVGNAQFPLGALF